MDINSPPTHTRLTALFPGLPECAGTRKVKPIWILLKQEKVPQCLKSPHLNDKLQGSVATKCDGVVSIQIKKGLLLSL